MTNSKFAFAILTLLLACGLAESAEQDMRIVNPSALTAGKALAASVSTANEALSLNDMAALTQFDGAIWGAGKNQIAQFDTQGIMLKSSALPLSQVAGIAAYEGGTILVGSSPDNTIYKFDPISSSVQKFLDLRQIDSSGVLAGDVLQNGELMSIASDGRYVFAAIRAGYSSSIFKIDPANGKIISRAWAPGPNPSIMAYNAGSLFVLDGSSNQLRRFDSDMKLSADSVLVADRMAKGILAADSAVQILSAEANRLKVTPVNAATMVASMPIGIADRSIASSKVSLDTGAAAIAQGSKVAVLICGDVAENGFEEFWSDTCWMYKTLRDAGYSAENIYVLYGSGNDHASDNPKYQSADTVTDFPATYVWVDKVFDGLLNGDSTNGISKMKSSDSLFVWTFDHGAGGDPAYLCLMDGDMDEGHFAAKLNALPFQKAAIFMQQCRSGGFIDSLQASKIFLSTACRSDQNAFPSNNEYETYNGQIYNHGEYNYYLICAISGKTPNGGTVNADTGGDSGISALEAHNWVANHEDLAEVPQMSDTGGVGSTFIIKTSSSGGIKFIKPEEALIREVIPIPKPTPDPIANRLSKMPRIG
ncbi:MAG: Peptidase C13 family protein [Methanosaeta sp. PtaU1.Bin112]|nr:MAG: Peptidase C13 family protein [Methanosaeta sp. PtaU1.Bin112]